MFTPKKHGMRMRREGPKIDPSLSTNLTKQKIPYHKNDLNHGRVTTGFKFVINLHLTCFCLSTPIQDNT